MSQRRLTRRRRFLSVTPKQVVLALIVLAVFLLVVTMLGNTNHPG